MRKYEGWLPLLLAILLHAVVWLLEGQGWTLRRLPRAMLLVYKMCIRDRLAAGRFQPSDYMIACEFPLAFGRIAGLLLALGAVSCWPVEAAYPILMVTDGLFWLVDHFVIDKKIQWLTEKL